MQVDKQVDMLGAAATGWPCVIPTMTPYRSQEGTPTLYTALSVT